MGARCPVCEGEVPTDASLRRELGKAGASGAVEVLRQLCDGVEGGEHYRRDLVTQLGERMKHDLPRARLLDGGSDGGQNRSVRMEVTWPRRRLLDLSIDAVEVPKGFDGFEVVRYEHRVASGAAHERRELDVVLRQSAVGDYELRIVARATVGVGTEGTFGASIPLNRPASSSVTNIKVSGNAIYSPVSSQLPLAGAPSVHAETAFQLHGIRAIRPAAWTLHVGDRLHAVIVAADRLSVGRGNSVELQPGEAVAGLGLICQLDPRDASISRRAVELSFVPRDVDVGRVVLRLAQKVEGDFDLLARMHPNVLPMVRGVPQRPGFALAIGPSDPVKVAVGNDGGPYGQSSARGRASLNIELERQFGRGSIAVCLSDDTASGGPTLVWLPTSRKAGWTSDVRGAESARNHVVQFMRDEQRHGIVVQPGPGESHFVAAEVPFSFSAGGQVWRLAPTGEVILG